MISKWQIDLERKSGSFGNFVVKWREIERGFSFEIINAPGLSDEMALELAGEAARALADALRRRSETGRMPSEAASPVGPLTGDDRLTPSAPLNLNGRSPARRDAGA